MDLRSKVLARQDGGFNNKLGKARVLIFGAGGLGSNVAMMLARAGISTIDIVDFDYVEETNLNRQIYGVEDIGKSKVEACKDLICKAIPYANINIHLLKVNVQNLDYFLDLSNIFIEAFDKAESKSFIFDKFIGLKDKYLISVNGIAGLDICESLKVKRFENITVFGDFESLEDKGLYSAKVMFYAALEAGETLKLIEKIY